MVGARGQFDVVVNDEVVATKKGGQFPDPEDAVAAVEARLQGSQTP
jgi:hypothetical protein